VYYYPRSLELSPGKRTSLHAKCVVVDAQTVFVSSANFTEAAHERNIEIGLLLRSKLLAERIVRHFDVLVRERLLRPVYQVPE
jgi:phosphatidylserine/phosphatidylglycerophosphate/cardiolipin synthase-like enzyme